MAFEKARDLEPKNKREEILSLTASNSKFMALSATGINPGAARHSALIHGKDAHSQTRGVRQPPTKEALPSAFALFACRVGRGATRKERTGLR